jgi:alpha-L-rhamnosidase
MSIKNAKWMCAEDSVQAPLFQKKVSVQNPENAVIDISGLGFFELYVNGKKVSDDLFVPSQSDYTTQRSSDYRCT